MAASKQTVESVLSLMVDRGLSIFAGLLAAFMILYSGYVLYDNIYTQSQAYGSSWDLLKYKPDIINDDSVPLTPSMLAEINKDYRAWLTVYDTKIDYPVMQGTDDLYYASHDVFKKTSLTGSLYLAAANSPDFSDTYNIIYGHHMDVDALFGGLDAYRDGSYMESHKTAVLVTSDSVYDATIFAVVEASAYDDVIYAPGNPSIESLLEYVKSKAMHYNDADAEGAVKILAMSTCESATTNGRLIVFAKLVKRDIPPDQIQILPPDSVITIDQYGNPVVTTVEPGQPEEALPNPDDSVPLAGLFYPSGSSYGHNAWALVNLICLILTIFVLLPIGFLRAKFSRARRMDEYNEDKRNLWNEENLEAQELMERARIFAAAMKRGNCTKDSDVTEPIFDEGVEEVYYEERKFRRRFIIGVVVEIVLVILAIILFILTEDMRLPMVLIDMWTPFMILFLLVTWVVDLRLVRYREDEPEQEEIPDPDATAPIPVVA